MVEKGTHETQDVRICYLTVPKDGACNRIIVDQWLPGDPYCIEKVSDTAIFQEGSNRQGHALQSVSTQVKRLCSVSCRCGLFSAPHTGFQSSRVLSPRSCYLPATPTSCTAQAPCPCGPCVGFLLCHRNRPSQGDSVGIAPPLESTGATVFPCRGQGHSQHKPQSTLASILLHQASYRVLLLVKVCWLKRLAGPTPAASVDTMYYGEYVIGS